jgi:hypothetical protein
MLPSKAFLAPSCEVSTEDATAGLPSARSVPVAAFATVGDKAAPEATAASMNKHSTQRMLIRRIFPVLLRQLHLYE